MALGGAILAVRSAAASLEGPVLAAPDLAPTGLNVAPQLSPLTAPAFPSLAPSPYDSDESLPAHAERVADYTLRARLDETSHVVHGEGTLTFRNVSPAPLSELWVHLYLNAFKNETSTFFRDPVGGGFRGVMRPKEWGAMDVRSFTLRQGPGIAEGSAPVDLWGGAEIRRPGDTDETDVRVPLPAQLPPGETLTIDMVWDAKLPSVILRTGFEGSFHMVGQWFPKLARLEPDGHFAHFPFHHMAEFYADFGTYDVTVDVPERYVLGASGPTVEAKVEGGRRIERHVLDDVHDFAWTAWDQFQVVRERIDGVDVTLLHPPGVRVVGQRELASLRAALPHFRERYGRYPYPVLTVVHPPEVAAEAGGMEYPTLITTGGPWFGPPGVFAPELYAVHEFGHQYFYGLVATNETAWPFLDEGVNTFAELDALGAWRGAGSVVSLLGLEVSDAALHAVGGGSAAQVEPVAQGAATFANGLDYARLVYSRTGSILETFRRTYGDAPVRAALGRYARKYRFRHPGPDELLQAFEETLGPSAREVLRVALFERGWVDYAVLGIRDAEVSDAAGLFDGPAGRQKVSPGGREGGARRREGWALLARKGTLRLPVDVRLALSDGTSRWARWDGEGDTVRIPYSGTAALVGVVVDPDEKVLLDADRANNHGSPSGRRGSMARTWERLVFWSQLAAEATAP